MPSIRITTQKQASDTRRSVHFCYLCGKRIKHGQERSGDHVVTRKCLGDYKEGSWPVLLDVHLDCHETKNKDGDLFINTWHQIMTAPSSEWNPQNLKNLRVRLKREWHEPTQTIKPVVEGIGPMMEGVWTWIRGFHAYLYKNYLPASFYNEVFPPSAGFIAPSKEDSGIPVEELEQHKLAILHLLDASKSADRFDGVLGWGETLQYGCFWIRPKRPFRWYRCFWGLIFQNLDQYAEGTGWPSTAWCGQYHCVTKPDTSSFMTEPLIDEYVAKKLS